MATVIFPDALPDIRYWLRNDPILNPLHGGRVFFRLPRTTQAPMLRVTQLGGGVQADSEAPIQDLQISVEIWGMQNSDYQAIRQIRLALEHICTQWVARSLLNPSSNTVMSNARDMTGYDSPDPETGWPRMICTLELTVQALYPTVLA